MAEPVDKEVCKAKHGELTRRAEVADKRLNAHAENLTDMKEVIIKLTLLQETSVQTLKDQNTAMAAIDKRVLELETQRVEAQRVDAIETEEKDKTFWNSSSGQWIIKGCVIIAVILTLAAIGQNVNPEFLASIFGK